MVPKSVLGGKVFSVKSALLAKEHAEESKTVGRPCTAEREQILGDHQNIKCTRSFRNFKRKVSQPYSLPVHVLKSKKSKINLRTLRNFFLSRSHKRVIIIDFFTILAFYPGLWYMTSRDV